jgi:hypothetical protein
MKWLCTVLNFFLPGLGYLVGVPEKRVVGIFWLLGVIGLTAVEQGMGLQAALPQAFQVMFGSVLVMNLGFAIDTFLIFKRKEAGGPAAAKA